MNETKTVQLKGSLDKIVSIAGTSKSYSKIKVKQSVRQHSKIFTTTFMKYILNGKEKAETNKKKC